jgi:DNA-binding PadR family transcriptional regulator
MPNSVDSKIKTRLLLMLWDLGGSTDQIKKSDLINSVKQGKEKVATYQPVLDELNEKGAIAITTKNRSDKVSLTDIGLQILEDCLKSPDFEYNARQRVRTKDFNAVLRWLRQINDNTKQVNSQPSISENKITSYDQFKPVALEVYDRLNRDFNYDNLVPIYRIRREIGEKVTRSLFSDWMLEMQANDIFQLQGGSVEDSAPDKIQDSISTELAGLRCYAKLLKI